MAAAKKVLVIDDDAAACGLVERLLTRLGLEVLTLADPQAGIETARSIIPDLIFINLLLPGTNGLKLSKAIHTIQSLEKVPVIMFISHQGELDSKYTVTIGILDTLVKPLNEAEVINKTKAILGDFSLTESEDETIREISLEEEIAPMILGEEGELTEEAVLDSDIEAAGEPIRGNAADPAYYRETIHEMTKEGELIMTEKENPFDKKEDDDRNLFTDESDIFGEELKKSRAGDRGKLLHEEHEDDSFPEDDVDLSYEEAKPASPVKRILLIAVSIVVGIGLGVGGYFFFTAGSKHAPAEKQIAKTLPEPSPIPVPAPAVIPSEKPNVIPEIPVKTEQQKPEATQAKEAKPQDSLPKPEAKKEPVKKAEVEKPNKEKAPAAVSIPEEKKTATPKRAAGNEAGIAVKGKRLYYVQAGLFENEANANAVSDKLKQKGFTPSVKKIEGKDKKIMFRVTAGTYANFKKAVEVSENLSKQGVRAIVHKQ